MTPRQTLRYWITEREAIRRRREAGDPAPWTTDPVLRDFRFTNVSRRFDRSTLVLAAHLARTKNARNRLLSVVAFRCFNRLTTWDALSDMATVRLWDEREAAKRLRALSASGLKICSGVWMSCGRKGEPVWRSQLRAVTDAAALAPAGTLEDSFRMLTTLPFVGPFVANEMVMDLAYLTPDLAEAPDRETFVRLGPGSVRGLRRLRGEEPGTGLSQPRPTDDDWREFRRTVEDLQGRPPFGGSLALTVHDVEHCLCEYDKYARGLEGGHLKNRFRGGA